MNLLKGSIADYCISSRDNGMVFYIFTSRILAVFFLQILQLFSIVLTSIVIIQDFPDPGVRNSPYEFDN